VNVQVYSTPLERVAPYDDFLDFCSSFQLTHGKDVDDGAEVVGEFKVEHTSALLVRSSFDLLPDLLLKQFADYSLGSLLVSPAIRFCFRPLSHWKLISKINLCKLCKLCKFM